MAGLKIHFWALEMTMALGFFPDLNTLYIRGQVPEYLLLQYKFVLSQQIRVLGIFCTMNIYQVK